MAVSAKLDTAATVKALKDLEKDLDRATMYALRAAGRVAKQTARKAAPVYKGTDKRIPPGRLKKSIHSSKRLRKPARNTYSVHVGPWGDGVNPYRAQANRNHAYMQPAYDEVQGRMTEQFNRAFTRTLEKRRG